MKERQDSGKCVCTDGREAPGWVEVLCEALLRCSGTKERLGRGRGSRGVGQRQSSRREGRWLWVRMRRDVTDPHPMETQTLWVLPSWLTRNGEQFRVMLTAVSHVTTGDLLVLDTALPFVLLPFVSELHLFCCSSSGPLQCRDCSAVDPGGPDWWT